MKKITLGMVALMTLFVATSSFAQLSLSDPIIAEGDSGATVVTITATISAPAPLGGTTVIYEFEDVTTDASDFNHTAGNVVIPQGQTTVDITVNITGDTDEESDETFRVNAKLDVFIDGTFSTGSTASFTVLPGITTCSGGSSGYSFEIGNQSTYDGGSGSTNKIVEVDCQSQGYQVLNTIVGADYIVTFDASKRTSVIGTVDTKVAAIDGSLPSGTEIASATATRSNNVFAFTQESFTFTATSTQTTIAFTSTNTDTIGMIFDNLSVIRDGSFDAISTVTITNDDTTLGVNDFTLSNVGVYPNPVTSNIFIKGLDKVDSVSIYNVLGSRVLVSDELTINVSALKPAIYLMKIENNGSQVTKRFIKK